MTESGMICVCVMVALVVLLPFGATLAELFVLRRKFDGLQREWGQTQTALALESERRKNQFTQLGLRLDNVERDVLMSGVEPGVYKESRDPVTNAVTVAREKDDKFQDLREAMSKAGSVTDILKEMQGALDG